MFYKTNWNPGIITKNQLYTLLEKGIIKYESESHEEITQSGGDFSHEKRYRKNEHPLTINGEEEIISNISFHDLNNDFHVFCTARTRNIRTGSTHHFFNGEFNKIPMDPKEANGADYTTTFHEGIIYQKITTRTSLQFNRGYNLGQFRLIYNEEEAFADAKELLDNSRIRLVGHDGKKLNSRQFEVDNGILYMGINLKNPVEKNGTVALANTYPDKTIILEAETNKRSDFFREIKRTDKLELPSNTNHNVYTNGRLFFDGSYGAFMLTKGPVEGLSVCKATFLNSCVDAVPRLMELESEEELTLKHGQLTCAIMFYKNSEPVEPRQHDGGNNGLSGVLFK